MKDLLKLAKDPLLFMGGIDLSGYLGNGDMLIVAAQWGIHGRLTFRYEDNSKPFYYEEFQWLNDEHTEATTVTKRFEGKYIGLQYEMPYYESRSPAKMVASDGYIFGPVTEWTILPESTTQKLDYDELARLIGKGINEFKNNKHVLQN